MKKLYLIKDALEEESKMIRTQFEFSKEYERNRFIGIVVMLLSYLIMAILGCTVHGLAACIFGGAVVLVLAGICIYHCRGNWPSRKQHLLEEKAYNKLMRKE